MWERDLLTVDGLPAVAPGFRFRHNRSMPEMKSERKPFVGTLVGVRQLTGRHVSSSFLPADPIGGRTTLAIMIDRLHTGLPKAHHRVGFSDDIVPEVSACGPT